MADNLENFAGWRPQQQESRYPLLDSCSGRSSDGYTLSNTFLIDASLAFTDSAQSLHISSISNSSGVVAISIRNQIDTEVGVATYAPTIADGELRVVDAAGRQLGMLLVDVAEAVKLFSEIRGVVSFDSDAAIFCPRCVHVYAADVVTGIAVEGLAANRGHVALIGEHGVVLRRVLSESITVEGVTGNFTVNQIEIDVVGDPLANAAECLSAGESAVFAETITGVRPDKYGNLRIVPDRSVLGTALRITSNPAQSEITIEIAGVGP